MALNRTALRTDIPYLSRRRKVAAPPEPMRPPSRSAAPADPVASGAVSRGLTLPTRHASSSGLTLATSHAGSSGLTLGTTPAPAPQTPSATESAASKPEHRSAPVPSDRLFPAPGFGSIRELGEANPVVRLNARQSGIGSLLVTGVRSVAWEDQQLITGAHHAEGHKAGTPVITSGNRALAGMQDGASLVSLRHIRQVRRLLFIAGDTPLTIGVFDGAAAVVAARNEAGLRSVLYAGRVGAILEFRTEFVPADASDKAIWAMFGFTMTIPLDQRVHLR